MGVFKSCLNWGNQGRVVPSVERNIFKASSYCFEIDGVCIFILSCIWLQLLGCCFVYVFCRIKSVICNHLLSSVC